MHWGLLSRARSHDETNVREGTNLLQRYQLRLRERPLSLRVHELEGRDHHTSDLGNMSGFLGSIRKSRTRSEVGAVGAMGGWGSLRFPPTTCRSGFPSPNQVVLRRVTSGQLGKVRSRLCQQTKSEKYDYSTLYGSQLDEICLLLHSKH